MRIALFSDIHANLPAFEVFLKDLDDRKPDVVYCLGDLVGYNVWPNEVISEIRRRSIATLAGNHDVKVKKTISEVTGKDYAYQLITAENKEYLKALPAHIRLEYKLGSENFNILLVHGSPRSNDEYILEDTDEHYVRGLLFEAKADILFCAHSHKPYHRILSRDDRFAHIINTGSVGKPKDGDPRGGYVLFTLNENSTLSEKESVKVEFIRFEYDVDQAALAVEKSPLPEEFADRLRKAY
ncbi:metallophosphoesterase family protein [Desertivirga xinjiangensis]|uniref:metallophosphoesterase family protein n=1 Tax=Desertivirga xinjiangensis TaxID=539206 RepID=UPI00210E48C5|nr:metallophosphoesterase family protein [Pedobacter xinjiangensis]